jgi:DNA repair exonuclease SbcCD ATPase subunit
MDDHSTIEAMQELAEQARANLDWLPENFRRDSLEESARVLLKSQTQAHARLTQATQAHREAEERIAELAARNEELEAALTAPYGVDDAQVYAEGYDEPYDAATPRVDARALLAQSAAHAQQAVTDAIVGPRVEAAYAQAEQLVTSQIPDFHNHREKIATEIAANPAWIERAAATGDPAELAGALANVYSAVATQDRLPDLMRTMKINAQSATGAGGRPAPVSDGEQRWQEIAAATNKGLGL